MRTSDDIDREGDLREVEAALHKDPGSVDLRFARAHMLDQLGKNSDAERAYRDVLALEASHFRALTDLGLLLYKTRRLAEALRLFALAVTKHPNEPIAHTNFAFMLLKGGDARGARDRYEAALRLDPDHLEAHRGLSLALGVLGDNELANVHAVNGFSERSVTTLPSRGDGNAIPLLVIASAGEGNLDLAHLLDDRLFQITKIVAEHASGLTKLPPHDVVVNAIGDADLALDALNACDALLEFSDAHVINRPSTLLATGRAAIARRLASVPNVVTPRIERCTRMMLNSANASDYLRSISISPPFLLRAAGFHSGKHFEKIDDIDALASALASMPGQEFFVIEYIDFADARSIYRKYRMMMVEGTLYPLHAALAPQWKVHYYSADMDAEPSYRDIDKLFLENPEMIIGERACRALEDICTLLALDYGGIDFAIDREGRVIVFEANAVMVIARPREDARYTYRRAPVEAVSQAFISMVRRRASLDGRSTSAISREHTAHAG